jgi:pimeloyl-ACP methyl ester carboxylesterase
MAKARPTLLCIHGFPLDHTLWDPQVAGLRDVADVLAPDLRGFGSDRRILPEVMTMEAFATDLKALLDERGVDRAVLCGLSMGGYIAMAFLELWPERVAGLILCNTRANADTPEGRAARKATAQNAFEKGVDVIARAMAPTLLSEHSKREHPGLMASMEAMIARQRPEAVAAAALGMSERPDRHHVLRSCTVPVLVITGSHDALMPLPTSQAMADALPNGRLVILEQTGHLSNLEATEAFNGTVREFVEMIP